MTRKCKPIAVQARVKRLSFYDLDGQTPARAVEIFEELREEFKGREVKLDYYHDDVEAYLDVYETRPETEIERDRRLASERAVLAWRRRQFELMKKEFGET